MPLSMPLEKMSIEEKMQIMESLWDDLAAHAAGMASPPWHGGILAERETGVKQGMEQFEDWDSAKQNIKKKIP